MDDVILYKVKKAMRKTMQRLAEEEKKGYRFVGYYCTEKDDGDFSITLNFKQRK